jgi:hypothetical protein
LVDYEHCASKGNYALARSLMYQARTQNIRQGTQLCHVTQVLRYTRSIVNFKNLTLRLSCLTYSACTCASQRSSQSASIVERSRRNMYRLLYRSCSTLKLVLLEHGVQSTLIEETSTSATCVHMSTYKYKCLLNLSSSPTHFILPNPPISHTHQPPQTHPAASQQ